MGFKSIFSQQMKWQITFGMVQSLEAIVKESDLPLMITLEMLYKMPSRTCCVKYGERNWDMDSIIQDLYPIQYTFELNKIGPACQKAGLDKSDQDHP